MEDQSVVTARLVAAAKMGEPKAFEALYNQTFPKMLGLARSLLKNEQDALDNLQESYLRAFRSLDKLQTPAYFSTWLYQIVQNQCKNFLTRTKPKLFATSLTDEEGADWDMEDDDIAFRPDESVDYSETKRIVREMVDALPEDQRICVLLFYFQDMKVQQIAETLGVSENTVKSRLNYARKKIRAQADELERTGTKLHGIAIFPFLYWMMGEGAVSAGAEAGALLLQSVLEGMGMAGAAVGATATAAAGTAAAGTMAAGATAAGTTAAGATAAGTTAAGTAVAGTTAAAGASSAAGVGVVQAFLGTVAGKVAVAAVAVGIAAGGVAVLNQPEPEPEPLPEPEPVVSVVAPAPESEPAFSFVFDERFPDQYGLPLDEYSLRMQLAGPVDIQSVNLETGDVVLNLKVGDEFRVKYTHPNAGMGGPHPWDGGEHILEMVETDDYDEKGTLYRAVGEGYGMMGSWCSGASGRSEPDPHRISIQMHISVTSTIPTAPVRVDTEEYAQEVIRLINEARAAAGRDELRLDDTLSQYAQLRAEEIPEHYSAIRPDGQYGTHYILWITGYRYAVESICKTEKEPAALVEEWMSSDKTLETLLKEDTVIIALGCHQADDGTLYLVRQLAGEEAFTAEGMEIFLRENPELVWPEITPADGKTAPDWVAPYVQFLQTFERTTDQYGNELWRHPNIDPADQKNLTCDTIILRFHDLENDGTPELLMAEARGGYMHAVWYEYRIRDGQAVYIGNQQMLNGRGQFGDPEVVWPGTQLAEFDIRDWDTLDAVYAWLREQ